VQAQTFRTYVSTTGNDNNPCSITAPCRHFQATVNVTPAGGEVDALDPGGYSAFMISQAITIDGQGWSYLAPPNGGTAITINANPGDNINIRGVSLNGVGTTGSTNGIVFNSGTTLHVENSVIRNFSVYGIEFQPNGSTPSQLSVSNTVSDNNGNTGIYISPTGSGSMKGVLDHIDAANNGYGLYVASIGPTINVTVSESVIANDGYGIASLSAGAPANVMVRNSTIANNGDYGLFAQGSGAGIWVTRSMITGNEFGWIADVDATVTSLADNIIVNNMNFNTAPPSIVYK
jgi:hypothetical protein